MPTLVETRNLKTYFPILKGFFRRQAGAVRAVDDVDITVNQGQWMGLVGESGCGKTTLGKTIVRLLKPTSGHIYLDTDDTIKDEIGLLEKTMDMQKLKKIEQEYDLALYHGKQLKAIRRRMQLVHQDPYTSLNPRMKIKDIIAEPLNVHRLLSRNEIKERVADILRLVGLTEEHLHRYPHQFSGGQRQRIAIARALATYPTFVVFDEPTSALDVSVQAQILELLKQLLQEQGLTYLYITHALTVAESVCDSIAVMYLGKIVEESKAIDIFQNPLHPYTQALVASTPIPDPKRKRGRIILSGEVPSPVNPPPGCSFHPRCPLANASKGCTEIMPTLRETTEGHWVRCHLV